MNAGAARQAIAAGVVLISLAACGSQTQPVSWYLAHREERVAKLRWCADSAEREGKPDCINAVEAEQKAMMQPNARTSADNLKFP